MGGLAVDDGGHAVLKKEACFLLWPPPHVSTTHVGDGGKTNKIGGRRDSPCGALSAEGAKVCVLCRGVLWWLLGAPKFNVDCGIQQSVRAQPRRSSTRERGFSQTGQSHRLVWWWWWVNSWTAVVHVHVHVHDRAYWPRGCAAACHVDELALAEPSELAA